MSSSHDNTALCMAMSRPPFTHLVASVMTTAVVPITRTAELQPRPLVACVAHPHAVLTPLDSGRHRVRTLQTPPPPVASHPLVPTMPPPLAERTRVTACTTTVSIRPPRPPLPRAVVPIRRHLVSYLPKLRLPLSARLVPLARDPLNKFRLAKLLIRP